MAQRSKYELLYDEELVPKNKAGSSKRLDDKALTHVNSIFTAYDEMRCFTRGGEEINIVDEWDEYYRIYKALFNQKDHSYKGESKVFMPMLRESVQIIESEASNALFNRDDYFSVTPKGTDPESDDMSRKAFGVLKYYSDMENYVSEFELSLKQALIYNHTVVESFYVKDKVEGIFRKLDEVPVIDPTTGSPFIDEQTGQVQTRKEYNLYKIDEDKASARVEVRDVYRMYINHKATDPEKDDMIYRDGFTAQELLVLAEQGVYNNAAVQAMLKQAPNPEYNSSQSRSGQGDGSGPTFIAEAKRGTHSDDLTPYEVLRFQGLFTESDEKTGKKIKKQYWIDIGERHHVLRIMESPVIGGYKTFSLCNYDSMPNEFYTDSVISPFKTLQYEINDKECQSLDGLTFNLNAPYEILKSSGLKGSDIVNARKRPNHPLFVNVMNSINKLVSNIPLEHLNIEQSRLAASIKSGTGATNLAAGAPTGTQADRSGKALGLLQSQTRSMFSKFVRKFERLLIQRSMTKILDIIIQFMDETIEIEVMDSQSKSTIHAQSTSEIIGQYNLRVTAGSQYLKEREHRDSILEFLSILGIDDTFLQLVDKASMLRDIAKTMPHNMAQYIDEDNFINQLQQQVQQMMQALEQQGEVNKDLIAETKRLTGVVKQTDRAAEASPSPLQQQELQSN